MNPMQRWWLLGEEAPTLVADLPPPWRGSVAGWATPTALPPALDTVLATHATVLVLLAGEGASRVVSDNEHAFRALLHARGLTHQVLHPLDGSHRLPLRRLLGMEATPPPPQRPLWRCEACSDPDCEHRLFQRLLAQRAG